MLSMLRIIMSSERLSLVNALLCCAVHHIAHLEMSITCLNVSHDITLTQPLTDMMSNLACSKDG